MSNALAILDTAHRALAEATTVEAVLDMRAKLDAVQTYMQQTKRFPIEKLVALAELKARAIRKLGDMLKAEDMHGGDRSSSSSASSLKRHGIPHNASSEAQRLAALPDDDFEQLLAAARERGEPITLVELNALAKPHAAKANKKKKHKGIADRASRSEIEGQFALIYADPPWKFDTYSWKGVVRSPDKHYPVLDLEDIKAFEVGGRTVPEISHRDAALWMWCTSANLCRALEVMEAWGFAYSTHAVWVKDKTGTGLVLLNQHELLLYGKRGNIPAPALLRSSVFQYPRRGHSEKPDEVREELGKMYPDFSETTRIELFARGAVPGWTVDGYEAAA